jgi:CDP-diacylglycerol---glycerol-3-phosphate 3-phosphatidyltransferase
MNLPNKLTLLRLGLVPAFMIFMVVDNFWTRLAALLIFIGASLTDLYDGMIARRDGTVTVIGTFLDPLVDKMLIAAALVGFVEMREISVPAWMVVLIISREFLITGLRSLAASRGVVLAAERAGKFKTASQVAAIIVILIILIFNAARVQWPGLGASTIGLAAALERLPYWAVFFVTLTTITSGYLYIQNHMDLLKKEFSILKGKPAKGKNG